MQLYALSIAQTVCWYLNVFELSTQTAASTKLTYKTVIGPNEKYDELHTVFKRSRGITETDYYIGVNACIAYGLVVN